MSSPPSALSPPVDFAIQQQDGDVERPAAQVVHREQPVLLLLQPVRQRRRRRLVQDAQHVQPRQPPRVLRGLSLRVVEISRHGDHRAAHRPQLVLGVRLEDLQDLG
jgi:hypothetical protein